jgi:hypothetical protein
MSDLLEARVDQDLLTQRIRPRVLAAHDFLPGFVRKLRTSATASDILHLIHTSERTTFGDGPGRSLGVAASP